MVSEVWNANFKRALQLQTVFFQPLSKKQTHECQVLELQNESAVFGP